MFSKHISYLKGLIFSKTPFPASNIIEMDAMFGTVYAFADDLVTDQMISFGAHTRPELAFLMSVVQSGDTVFDIGGHIGTFAIPLAQKNWDGGTRAGCRRQSTQFRTSVP
jgi:hypothetical protein